MVDTATAPLAQRSPLRPRFLYQPVRPCGPQEQDQDGHGPLIIGFRIDAGATGDGITADAASLLQGTATPGTLARLMLGTGQTGIALGRLLGGGVVTNRVAMRPPMRSPAMKLPTSSPVGPAPIRWRVRAAMTSSSAGSWRRRHHSHGHRQGGALGRRYSLRLKQ
nr:hypothetical protein [Belnapia rosea]